MISFPPSRLDVADHQLWKGTKLVALRKKPLAFLAAHPNRLVTHDDLLAAARGHRARDLELLALRAEYA